MGYFCTEYLLSAPFQLGAEGSALEQNVKAGYFAFQDYACLHVYGMSTSFMESSNQEANDLHRSPLSLLEQFQKTYSVQKKRTNEHLDQDKYEDTTSEPSSLPPLNARTQWKGLESRISHIRDTIEDSWISALSNHKQDPTMKEIYGEPGYKCPQIGCVRFDTGFKTKALREEHVRRHIRPILCTEAGCHYQILGFETNDQLERHLRMHGMGSEKEMEFPSPSPRKYSSISQAAAKGDLLAVQRFLDDGEDVNATARYAKVKGPPLLHAARKSHLNVCKLLIERGAEIGFAYAGPTVLHIAATNNDLEMIEYLLSLVATKAIFNKCDLDGKTALDRAVEANETSVTEVLQSYVAEQRKQQFIMDLNSGICTDDAEEMKMLLNAEDFNPEMTNLIGRTALSCVKIPTVAEILLASGKVQVDSRSRDGRTPLSYAAENGNDALVKLYLEQGANANLRDKTGRTALSHAKTAAVAEVLLANGKVQVDARSGDGRTPLSYAAGNGNNGLVEVLLKHGANVNSQEKTGRTPLFHAAICGTVDVIQSLLVVPGLDGGVRDGWGRTAFGYALSNGYLATIRPFLAAFPDAIDLADESGLTPFSRAVANGNWLLAKVLLETGKVNPDYLDENGQTPLSQACIKGNVFIINMLLESTQVDINRKDKWGYTPLARAVLDGHSGVVEALLRTGKVDISAPTDGTHSLLQLATMTRPNIKDVITEMLQSYSKKQHPKEANLDSDLSVNLLSVAYIPYSYYWSLSHF